MKNAILEANLEKDKIRSIYCRIASTYDIWGRLTESKARDKCLEFAEIKDGLSILEVAVGTGLAFEKILKLNPTGRNEGIDLTNEMLNQAKEKAALSETRNYNLELGDAYSLNFEINTFDTIINNYMFDLLPENDFTLVLEEFKRVLKPGGRLAMVNMAHGRHWYNFIWKALYWISPSILGGCRGISLKPYLEKAGYRIIHMELINQMTFPSEVIICEKS